MRGCACDVQIRVCTRCDISNIDNLVTRRYLYTWHSLSRCLSTFLESLVMSHQRILTSRISFVYAIKFDFNRRSINLEWNKRRLVGRSLVQSIANCVSSAEIVKRTSRLAILIPISRIVPMYRYSNVYVHVVYRRGSMRSHASTLIDAIYISSRRVQRVLESCMHFC